MKRDYPEEILASVKKPSRYLGEEPFFPYKDWGQVKLRVCLGYPDLYEVGRSHLGLNLLSGIINSQEDYLCDLVFAVAPDFERALKERNFPLLSFNYKRPLRNFEVVGLSYAYELLVTGIFQILELSGIPFKAEERDETFPIILGGGPCCGNPEPIAPLFDALIIGDAEEAILEVLETIKNWRESQEKKASLFEALTKIEGVYVPLLKNRVKRRIFLSLNKVPKLYSLSLIPLSHDRISLEISRGCTRSCRFCEAGFYYRPVREKSPEEILKEALEAFSKTGYREASLMSLSAGDYTSLQELVRLLDKTFYQTPQREFIFTLPSLRVGSLTPEILQFLKKGRTSTLTLAVEAASARLRGVINKEIDLEALFEDISLARKEGFRRIKLYFMLGLPTETEEDLIELINLYRELKKNFRDMEIIFSASIFIPKPHTPFQWERQITLDEAYEKIGFVKRALKDHFKAHDPKQSLLEGVIARAGRELFSYLLEVYHQGARLDSWKEYLDFSLWKAVANKLNLELGAYLRERDPALPLPWEHLDLGIKKEFLLKEREKAYQGEFTRDCRFSECAKCGLCRGKVKNYLVKDLAKKKDEFSISKIAVLDLKEKSKEEKKEFWYELIYEKTGKAKFLSQLEILRLFELALRRLGVPLSYTQGFNPRPRFISSSATPVGIEAIGERLFLALTEKVEETLFKSLEIYQGLKIIKAKFCGTEKPKVVEEKIFYLLQPLKAEDIALIKGLAEKDESFCLEELKEKGMYKIVPKEKNFSFLKTLKSLGIEEPLKVFKIIKVLEANT